MAGEVDAEKARHDLGNLLTIAQTSVEAMLDGVVPVTEERLNRLREILSDTQAVLDAAFPPRRGTA
jgi:hypothetical protein